jgi:hypothetical protein
MEEDMVMSRRNCSGSLSTLAVAAALGISAPVQPAVADVITSFSVGSDQTLTYTPDLVDLPDEHTTFLPQRVPGRAVGVTYLVFAASSILKGPAGTVALQTSDLTKFTYAAGYTNPVMVPPNNFMTCNSPSTSTNNIGFDENYAAPGSVLQDPTRPPGHFIMIYEAENHCPGGVWQRQFYATIGFARSTDFGKTWPAPINAEYGAKDRRPVLKINIPEPTTAFATYTGNAIPSAFIEPIRPSSSVHAHSRHYIYVTYILA